MLVWLNLGSQSSRAGAAGTSCTDCVRVLMTSLAFILGVAPLVVATGAGAEMRQIRSSARTGRRGVDGTAAPEAMTGNPPADQERAGERTSPPQLG